METKPPRVTTLPLESAVGSVLLFSDGIRDREARPNITPSARGDDQNTEYRLLRAKVGYFFTTVTGIRYSGTLNVPFDNSLQKMIVTGKLHSPRTSDSIWVLFLVSSQSY